MKSRRALWFGLACVVLVVAGVTLWPRKPIEPPTDFDIGIEWVALPAGLANIGPTPHDAASMVVLQQKSTVDIPNGLFLSKHEISRRQWAFVMNGSTEGVDGGDLPIDRVTFEQAREFCRKLSSPGKLIRLPNEAEWEYGCRSGAATAFAFGDRLDPNQANVRQTLAGDGKAGDGKPCPVTSNPANGWGLCNMHGNVWEWCLPLPTVGSGLAVVRGGSWRSLPSDATSFHRTIVPADTAANDIGFRVLADCR